MIKLEKWFDTTTIEGLPFCSRTSAVRPAMPNTSMPAATLLIWNMKICASGARTVRSQPRHPEDARGRRQRIVHNLEAAASRHAAQIDVKRQSSKGPQSYAYSPITGLARQVGNEEARNFSSFTSAGVSFWLTDRNVCLAALGPTPASARTLDGLRGIAANRAHA
ncbi:MULTISPECIES: hypothetical protein [Bradyrhizobium]|uniref:hypothetical protein n=1 Tax=Bradyrhizobium TaxID=374 RepID=UPI001FF05C2E|nr:hypothetical protein [Bradyrhizobium sp. USDA 3456]